MTGTANPIDLIGGIATSGNVPKADISAWGKARVPQLMANASEIRSTNLAGQLMVTLNATGARLFLDASDHTTADDGVNCIVSADGFRFKLMSEPGELFSANNLSDVANAARGAE